MEIMELLLKTGARDSPDKVSTYEVVIIIIMQP